MNQNYQENDYLSITRFAELVGMTRGTLRHYDQSGVFRPSKQGVKFENKYRYYSPTQLPTAKMIRTLAEIGVPLEIIKDLAQNRTPEKMMKLLSKHRDIVTDELRFLQEVNTVISTFLEMLTIGISASESEIHVAEMPGKQIVLGDENDLENYVFDKELMRFCIAPHDPILNLSFPIGGYWDSMDVFTHEPGKPVRFFSLDPNGNDQKAAGLYLIGYTRGYYGQINDLPGRMLAFAKKNGLLFNGPVYKLYILGELCVTDQNQYLIQISASVKETRRVSTRRPNRC
jgi:DNA-binding transcriptional MerR regulator